MTSPASTDRRLQRHDALRAALNADPLVTDAGLAGLLGVSVQTVRLDRLALGIPEVRGRAREVAERSLRGQPRRTVRGEVVDLDPGRSAVALLPTATAAWAAAPWASDPDLFADAEALALAASGLAPADVQVVNVKFRRATREGGRLVAKAEVLRRRAVGADERRVVLVQIHAGDQPVFRAKFVVGAIAGIRAREGV